MVKSLFFSLTMAVATILVSTSIYANNDCDQQTNQIVKQNCLNLLKISEEKKQTVKENLKRYLQGNGEVNTMTSPHQYKPLKISTMTTPHNPSRSNPVPTPPSHNLDSQQGKSPVRINYN